MLTAAPFHIHCVLADGRKTLFTTQKFLGPSFELAVEMRDVTPGPPASAASQQLLALHQGQDRAAKRVTYLVSHTHSGTAKCDLARQAF
jgi:hypothetical protein